MVNGDDPDRLEQFAWRLDDESTGASAEGTGLDLHRRPQQGWFAAADPSGTRRLYLSKVEETVYADGERWELGANQYNEVIHPQGYRFLDEFVVDPNPTWRWTLGDVGVERSLAFRDGALIVTYRALDASVALELRPLLAGRPIDEVQVDNPQLNRASQVAGETATIELYPGAGKISLTVPGAQFLPDECWYYRFHYTETDQWEDLYNPGMWMAPLRGGATLELSFQLS